MSDKKEETAKAVVAPGRTIEMGSKSFGPGAEITLPVGEIASLTASGFLVDPKAKPLPRAEGPVLKSKSGLGFVG